MSHWRSKSSNKQSDPKMFRINHSSTSVVLSQETETGKTQTTAKDVNPSTLRNFFSFAPPMTEKEQTHQLSTAITSIGWEQILDRGFQSLDIDADGYVSVADLQSVLRNFSHVCNSNEIILRILEELDMNHDQRISKQEFKLYKKILVDREKRFARSSWNERFASIFALFDQNQDNYISPHEVRETMQNLGEQIDDHLLNEMMQTADTDHDGRISRDEFEQLLDQLNRKT